MSKVFVSVTMSLDGFIAPAGEYGTKEWLAPWMELQAFVLQQKFFREKLKITTAARRAKTTRSSSKRSPARV